MCNFDKSDILISTLNSLIFDAKIQDTPPSELLDIEGFESLYNALLDFRKTFISIANGKITGNISSKGYLPGAIKSLQASMQHLVWQIKAITVGDFTQRVDFLGEFSDAFNNMTKQLETTMKELEKSREMYRILAENVTDVIWTIDPKALRFVYVSPSVYELRGYTPEEVMAEPMDASLTPEGAAYAREVINQRADEILSQTPPQTKFFVEELEQPCKDGSLVWTEVVTNYYINKQTGNVEITGISRDISKRKLAEEKLKKSEQQYRYLFENAVEMIVVVQDGMLKICNPMVHEITGYNEDELLTTPFWEFVHQEDREFIVENHIKRLKGEKFETKYCIKLLKKDKNIVWVEMNSVKIDWEGKPATLNFFTDITKRKKSEEKILYLSYNDQLTGLYNRRFYEEELARLDTEENLPISLIMADINGLKLTNDAFGHLAGDKLISETAGILKKECRNGDVLARIGGDEFIFLLPKTTYLEAEKILKSITKLNIDKKIDNIIFSVSFGVATKNLANEDINKVYIRAEDNMYRHKLLESKSMKSETIKLITKTLYEKSEIEQKHYQRVSELCKKIGMSLGFVSDDVNELGIAGMLHDIGKIGIDDSILNKVSTLNDEDWIEIKRHPEIGYQILKAVSEFSQTAEYILAHHEKLDGTGYPRGLKGDDIPLQSRIIFVAEAYDTMTNKSIYKDALSKDEAINEIKLNAGIAFDEAVARVFIENVLGEKW